MANNKQKADRQKRNPKPKSQSGPIVPALVESEDAAPVAAPLRPIGKIPEPFDPSLPPLVPGQPESALEFRFWEHERENDALRAVLRQSQQLVLKLDGMLIEVQGFLKRTVGHFVGLEGNEHEKMLGLMDGIDGLLKSQDTLLEDIHAANIYVHPDLGDVVAKQKRGDADDQ
ncbi:MAG TPA: hypothetical protein VGH16_11400 [Candidatus Binatia bacterium]|jgi:hypothetical protein